MSIVERFTFPQVREPARDMPAREQRQLVWPEREVTETVFACADAAERILLQTIRDRLRVVMFTSPGDADGTTSVLVALAPELARRATGDILVVDANLRKPDLTSRLNLSVDGAVTETTLIYPTNLPRLCVLPAVASEHPPQPTAATLSWFNRDEVGEDWTLVLIDAASLMHPEVAPLAASCDGVYLVVRLGHTARRALAEAAHVLRSVGGRLLGCVVVG